MWLLVLALFSWEWVETTQQDFRDGWFTRDLYSSHRGDGSVEFAGRFDLNNDDYLDILGNTWIMWGSDQGYSSSKTTVYPTSGTSGGCDAADVDTDGYPEYITTEMGGITRVFWGGAQGPSPNSPLQLSVSNYNNEGVFAADFNKDGYLDLLASIDDSYAAIFWGSADGYSTSNRTSLPCYKTGYNPEAADLNKDGWLDVIVVSGEGPNNYIYWGGPGGFDESSFTQITYVDMGQHGVSIADLDYDGWLDIVYSHNCYGVNDAYVLWGDANVYRPGEFRDLSWTLPLPDRAFGGSSIADLNENGYLDIVFFGNDGVPPRIFWGDFDGLSPSRYTDLSVTFGVGTGGMVADYTGDGHIDIVELSYERTVLFEGPNFNQINEFGITSHHGFSREVGNVYTREYVEEYYSSVFDAGGEVVWDTIHWEDSLPGSSSVSLAIRTGDDADTSSGWSDWIVVQNDSQIPGNLRTRYIQYRATFAYDNPAHLPVLFLVGITYYGLEEIIVRPDRHGSGFPGDTIPYTLNVINFTHMADVVEISYVIDNPDWFHEVRDSVGNPLGDADVDGSPDVGELDPLGDSTRLNVRVGIPLNPSVTADTMIVYGHSSNPMGLYDSALVITTILAPVRIIVDPNQDTVAYPGQTIDFALWGINYGKDPDVIDLVTTSARGWQVDLLDSAATSTLIDNDADLIPDLGEVEDRGGRVDFTTRVHIPPAALPPVSDTVWVTGISSQDTLVTDLAILIIEVLPEVWIEVEPDQDTIAYPGQQVDFSLWEANHGRWDDVIDLTTHSVSGWQVELLDSAAVSSLGDYDSDGLPDAGVVPLTGERAYFSARITVPATALLGEPDTVYILGTSSNDTSVTDLATLIINPQEISLLEIRPDQEGSVSTDAPAIRYTLEVINHGNVVDVGAISCRGYLGWTTSLLDSTGRRPLEDSDGDGTPDVGEIAPFGGVCTLFTEITLPEAFDPTRGTLDTLSGLFTLAETTVVYVSSASHKVVHDSALLVTAALPGLAMHNFPNPFEGETRIVWSQPEDGMINLRVADRAGRPVGTILYEHCDAGVHSTLWDANTALGEPLAPGVYIILLDFKPPDGPSRRIMTKALCAGRGPQ